MKPHRNKNLNYSRKVHTVKYLFLCVLSFLILTGIKAQNPPNSAYATASATIVTEMAGIEKLDDINFANIHAVSKSRRINGNAALNITGSSYAYSITLSSEEITVKKNGSNVTMEVGSVTISLSEGNTGDNTLEINAAINADNNQAAGAYTSTTPLTVIINYN